MNETLDAASADAQLHPDRVLTAHPWLGAAIDADAAAGRFDRWGLSTVIDENLGSPVLPRALFEALHARADVEAQWPIGNAGVLHVYGYLLSVTPTPYGRKRDRWLDGALARAYGLDDAAFAPWASATTLLDRVTESASALLARTVVRTSLVGGVVASVAIDRASDDGAWALVYAVDGRIVTTFPVSSPEAILAEWDAAPTRPRWNAAV